MVASPARKLQCAVAVLPRVGIHSTPLTVTAAPRSFHPDQTAVVIAEEHGGFALGGNKVRQVDVLLAEVVKKGADAVITSAGPQSNFCRVMAAGARACGLEPHLVLRGTGLPDHVAGNQLLYKLCGANLSWVQTKDPLDASQEQAMQQLAQELRERGRHPAVIDIRSGDAGLTCALAATAIVDELASKCSPLPDRIVMAAGSGNTAAGILAALAARGASTRVIAVASAIEGHRLRPRIYALARKVLEYVDVSPELVSEHSLEVDGAQLGHGHGEPTPAALEAQERTARHCGVFLDTTYTAKAMASLLADRREGSVVFVHSGGAPTIFS